MIKLFTLKNKRGTVVTLTNYGATVISLKTADRSGRKADILLGFKNLSGFVKAKGGPYFGSTIGRYANRINGASFKIGAKRHHVSANQGKNCLHGGVVGFDKKVWEAEKIKGKNYLGVKFKLFSPDGDQGFPGNLHAEAIYTLSEDNALSFEFKAKSDQATHVAMTNHCYFNLKGEGQGDILDHRVWINADRYLPVTSLSIPTGKINPVKNTPYDFRVPKIIGGFVDHNFILNKTPKKAALTLAAKAYSPQSGRSLELWTNEPGLQFYSGGHLKGTIKGKSGVIYKKHFGFCFEPQHFPDSPNHKNFPSTLLRPGKIYRAKTKIRFFA